MMIPSFHSRPTRTLGVVRSVREKHTAHSGGGGGGGGGG